LESKTKQTALLSKRDLLKWGGVSLISLALPMSWSKFDEIIPSSGTQKSLSLYNIHTGEALKKCVFWANGQFDPDALKTISRLFRDHRTNVVHTIDQKLLALLHNLTKKLGTQKPIHLVSGYRCRETNNQLRIQSYGVAKHSQHTLGKAADLFIEGHSLKKIQSAALSLKGGGVGRYDSFVHLDTGPVRRWGLV